jgi:hypothetical protein
MKRKKLQFHFQKSLLYSMLALALCGLVTSGRSAMAQTNVFTATDRIEHVQKAYIENIGAWSFYSSSGAYYNAKGFVTTPGSYIALSDVNSGLALEYSITRNISASANTIVYQDSFDPRYNGSGKSTNNELFSAVGVNLRAASFSTANDHVKFGAMVRVIFPTSSRSNEPFLPYNPGSLQGGVLVLISYYTDNFFPSKGLGIHLNAGWHNYNDVLSDLSRIPGSQFLVSYQTQSARYGLGIEYPLKFADIFGEAWGEYYLGQIVPIAYGRDNYTYSTFGAKIHVYRWLDVEVSGDVLLSGSKGSTDYTIGAAYGVYKISNLNINYLPWRFNVGFKFQFGSNKSMFTAQNTNIEDTRDSQRQFIGDEQQRNREVLSFLDEQSTDLYSIYADALHVDPTLSGRAYFEVVIGTDGKVTSARVLVTTFDETQLGLQTERYMLEAIRKWRFPKGKSPITIEVLKYTFTPAKTERQK